ncbi:hypothetical protein AADZ84_13425 [Colwelliaceae bacterium MEBiC 14330]
MSPKQLKTLQELSQVFSQGKANPKQIQQLSDLLAQINRYHGTQLGDRSSLT